MSARCLLLAIAPGAPAAEARHGAGVPAEIVGPLRRELPTVSSDVGDGPAGAIPIDAHHWDAEAVDLWTFDERCDAAVDAGRLELALTAPEHRLLGLTLEVLTRVQRCTRRTNAASGRFPFAALLARHSRMHDVAKPLVRADLRHALDTWQWLLRLEPRAGTALQAAALLHDVERLLGETEERREQHATDYDAFKAAHAARGARIAAELARDCGFSHREVEVVRTLVAAHERPPRAGEPASAARRYLNDADALSFFSLNSTGYLAYFGGAQARRKVRWTLARMSEGARHRLAFGIRVPQALMPLVLDDSAAEGVGHA